MNSMDVKKSKGKSETPFSEIPKIAKRSDNTTVLYDVPIEKKNSKKTNNDFNVYINDGSNIITSNISQKKISAKLSVLEASDKETFSTEKIIQTQLFKIYALSSYNINQNF